MYTLILYEKSSGEFHKFPNEYLHRIRPESDTGLVLEWPQEHVLIPLDIFRAKLQNKGIDNELDAWLTFLSVDEPEMIGQLIKEYPQFKPMYQQIYDICRNMERVIELYSEELRILDRNTVQLMIDEMQDEIDEMQDEIDEMHDEIDGQKKILIQKDEQLSQKDQQIEQQLQEIERLKKQLSGK